MSKSFFILENRILVWAANKGILKNATRQAQANKTLEEVTELFQAIESNDPPEIKDAIGDIIVTLIIQAELNGISAIDCLESAYEVIKNRTGKMINGQFVKD